MRDGGSSSLCRRAHQISTTSWDSNNAARCGIRLSLMKRAAQSGSRSGVRGHGARDNRGALGPRVAAGSWRACPLQLVNPTLELCRTPPATPAPPEDVLHVQLVRVVTRRALEIGRAHV